mgnify:CR=1 FL=1
MHIINSTAKGGVIIEEGAMTDAEEFKKNYPKPEGVAVVKDGAISKGNSGAIFTLLSEKVVTVLEFN